MVFSVNIIGLNIQPTLRSASETVPHRVRYLPIRQQLLNKKQSENESVAQFATEIRRLCQRLEVPGEQSVNYFLNGLRPELKNYVILQRPKTFSEAETFANLKEAIPEEKSLDRTEEILSAIAKLRSTEEPKVASYNVPLGHIYTDNPNADYGDNQPLDREEVAHIVRRELERQNYYNHRRDRNVICYHCGKNGHGSSVCRIRRYDNVNSGNITPSQNTRRYRQNENLGSAQRLAYPTNGQYLN